MSRKRKAIKGAIIDYIGSFGSIALNIILIPFFLSKLGSKEYGIWLTVQSLMFLVGILEPGTVAYLTKKFSDRDVFSDTNNARIYFSNSLFIQCIAIAVALAAGAILYIFIRSSMFGEAANSQVAIIYFISLGTTAFSMFTGIFRSVVISQQYIATANMAALGNALSFNLLSALLLHLNFGIIALAYAQLLATVIFEGTMILVVKRRYKGMMWKASDISSAQISEIMLYARSFFLIKIGDIVRGNYVRLMIGRFLGPTQVSVFSVTNKVPELIPGYISKITSSFFPGLSELFASKNTARIGTFYLQFFQLIIRLAIFGSIGVYFLSEPFIRLWVGKEQYAGDAVVALLAIFVIQKTLTSSLGVFMFASGNFARAPTVTLVEVAISIAISLSLYEKYRLFGIVLGLVLGSFLSCSYYHVHVVNILQIRLIHSLRKATAFALVPNFLSFLGGWALQLIWMPAGWIELGLFGLFLAALNVLPRELRFFIRSDAGTFTNRCRAAISRSLET